MGNIGFSFIQNYGKLILNFFYVFYRWGDFNFRDGLSARFHTYGGLVFIRQGYIIRFCQQQRGFLEIFLYYWNRNPSSRLKLNFVMMMIIINTIIWLTEKNIRCGEREREMNAISKDIWKELRHRLYFFWNEIAEHRIWQCKRVINLLMVSPGALQDLSQHR